MQKITPFLWFDNQAEEAANFYTSIFKNSKIGTVSRYGEAGPGPKGTVILVTFQLEGEEFIALNGGPLFKFTEAISLSVNCQTQEEVDELWEKLSEGGEKGRCGWLKDKYGLSWQIKQRDHQERLLGFRSSLETLAPNMRIVGVEQALDREEICYRFTKALLEQDSSLNAVYHFGADMNGIVHAIQEADRTDEIFVIGHELTDISRQLLARRASFVSLPSEFEFFSLVRRSGIAMIQARSPELIALLVDME